MFKHNGYKLKVNFAETLVLPDHVLKTVRLIIQLNLELVYVY